MSRTLINVQSCLQDFNPTKFTVYFSLLLFSILLSLRLDNRITLPYWLVFMPLWVWKSLTILGAFVGAIVWLRNPDYRASQSSHVHFKSMLISLSLQLLLLMFEILVCDKLETRRHTWTLAFIPLIFLSLLSISVCIWSVNNNRGIELEFFAAINILQIVLIALKLDNFVNWSWMVVFTPSWILLSFAIIVMIYSMIYATIVLRSSNSNNDQHQTLRSASSSSMVFLPLLVFIILLTSKLDTPPNMISPSYFLTCLPLFMTLLILIRMSFGSKTGSLWWFGMRRDFCTFLLTICPSLREYGNTSFMYTFRPGDNVVAASSASIVPDSAAVPPFDIPSNYIAVSTSSSSSTSTSSSLNDEQQPRGETFNSSTSRSQNHRRNCHRLYGHRANQLRTDGSSGGTAKHLLYSLTKLMFSRGKNQNRVESDGSSRLDQEVPRLRIDAPD